MITPEPDTDGGSRELHPANRSVVVRCVEGNRSGPNFDCDPPSARLEPQLAVLLCGLSRGGAHSGAVEGEGSYLGLAALRRNLFAIEQETYA